ncbi:MAG: TRAP transporter small permease [Nitrospinaceae bacterium]
MIKQFDRGLANAEAALLILTLLTMVGLSFGQVILRNFFNEGLVWADILVRQLVLWVGFLGASLAVRKRKHLAIDILPHVVSARWKRILRIISDLAAGVISIFLALAALEFMQLEREAGSLLFQGVPTWWFLTILPYSLAVISLRFLFDALNGGGEAA